MEVAPADSPPPRGTRGSQAPSERDMPAQARALPDRTAPLCTRTRLNYPRHAVLRALLAVVYLASILGSTHTHRTLCYTSTHLHSACSGSPTSFRRTATSPRWASRGPLTSCHGLAAWPLDQRLPQLQMPFFPALTGPGMRATEMPKRGCGGSGAFEDWCLQRVAHPTAFGHAGRRSCQRSSSSW